MFFFNEKKTAQTVYLKGIFEVTFEQYLKKKFLKKLENGGTGTEIIFIFFICFFTLYEPQLPSENRK